MPKRSRSRHDHGPSEIHLRPGLARTIRAERKRLGTRLRDLRVRRELTLEEAAEAIGIHSVHLHRLEHGKTNVTLATLVAAATAYRVNLRTLF